MVHFSVPLDTDTTSSSGLLSRQSGDPVIQGPGTAGDDWPDYESGYAVILSTNTERSGAESVAAAEGGGVLRSTAYPDLTPGYWVAYAGPFSTEAEARAALPAYLDSHADAYVKFVDGAGVAE